MSSNMRKEIYQLDIVTQRLNNSIKENNKLTDCEYVKLINSFDRFQELIKLIKIK